MILIKHKARAQPQKRTYCNDALVISPMMGTSRQDTLHRWVRTSSQDRATKGKNKSVYKSTPSKKPRKTKALRFFNTPSCRITVNSGGVSKPLTFLQEIRSAQKWCASTKINGMREKTLKPVLQVDLVKGMSSAAITTKIGKTIQASDAWRQNCTSMDRAKAIGFAEVYSTMKVSCGARAPMPPPLTMLTMMPASPSCATCWRTLLSPPLSGPCH
mmetsp:Transcript_66099/g.166685  ORF Transcript_66099/g.166685 Transcript_66099/m.166685 type:complete len:215 (-) Transcript_66099:3-647(-)